MRQHGVAFPDPNASGQQSVRISDPNAFDAANSACARYRVANPRNKMTPAQQAEFQDKALQFSRCMRAHGVNVPDPQTTGNGGAVRVVKGAGVPGPDPSDPAFQSAQKACQSLLPNPGPENQTFHGAGPAPGVSVYSGRKGG